MISRLAVRVLLVALLFGALPSRLSAQTSPVGVDVALITGSAPSGYVEFTGVEADEFDPAIWRSGTLNMVPDYRHPFVSPLNGTYRNIYAPSLTETPTGYRFFYGAWDGLPHPPKDRIYAGTTDFEFLNVQNRKSIVLPGTFGHVCNVNALRFPDGSYRMFGTVEFTANPHKNRPAFFWSDTTGTNWNGTSGEPYTVKSSDFISISGYTNEFGTDKFPTSDINGANVMLHEDGVYRLYFSDFDDAATGFKVYRATSINGKDYTYDGVALNQNHSLPNDVKKFRHNGMDWYLMGLHFNGFGLWQSLSTNGVAFPTSSLMFTNLNTMDRYIVAMGWVVRGEENQEGRKLLGILYGAGATSSLDQNRIFARWLQKKVIFVGKDGARFTNNLSYGPNRQLLRFPGTNVYSGHIEVYNENGTQSIGRSLPFSARHGQRLEIKFVPSVELPGVFNTGVSTNGTLLASGEVDPHYQLISSADVSFPGPNAVTVNEPLPSTIWEDNSPDSKWIAARASATNAPGYYTYRTTFVLSNADPRMVTIAGRWACDNSGTNITVNGISNRVTSTFSSSWKIFSLTDHLVSGTNTVDFLVRNSGSSANRTGVRVELSAFAPLNTSFTAPTVTLNPLNISGKQGTNLLLMANGIGTLPLTFQWEHNGAPLAGETNAMLIMLNAQPDVSGEYRMKINNLAGEVYSAAATIEITPPTPPRFQNFSMHPDGSSFALSVSGDSGDRYLLETSTNLVQWSFVRNLTNVNGSISIAEPVQSDGQRYYRLQITP